MKAPGHDFAKTLRLSLNFGTDSPWSNLVFLSARPHAYKGSASIAAPLSLSIYIYICAATVALSSRDNFLLPCRYVEAVTYRKFSKMVDEGFLHAMPALLPGDLLAGAQVFSYFCIRGNFSEAASLVPGKILNDEWGEEGVNFWEALNKPPTRVRTGNRSPPDKCPPLQQAMLLKLGKLGRGMRNWRPVGEKKFDAFSKFVNLYPDFSFVFIGDNGQGDV